MNWRPILSRISPRLAPWCERRKNERLGFEGLFCNHGRIVNISMSGASIITTDQLSGTVEIRLHEAPEDAAIEAEVVWSKRIRPKVYEVGVEFTGLSPGATRLLEMIVAAHARESGAAAG